MYFVHFRGSNARYAFVSHDVDEISRFVSHLLTHSLFCPLYDIHVSRFLDRSITEDVLSGDIEDFDDFKVYVQYDQFDEDYIFLIL